jgi:hypothetical protein
MSKCTLNLLPADDLKLSDSKPVPPFAIPGQYELPGFVQEGRTRKRG